MRASRSSDMNQGFFAYLGSTADTRGGGEEGRSVNTPEKKKDTRRQADHLPHPPCPAYSNVGGRSLHRDLLFGFTSPTVVCGESTTRRQGTGIYGRNNDTSRTRTDQIFLCIYHGRSPALIAPEG